MSFCQKLVQMILNLQRLRRTTLKRGFKIKYQKTINKWLYCFKKNFMAPFIAHCSSTRPLLLIPALTLKQSVETYLHVFKNTINLAISECELFDQLQNWKWSPCAKKNQNSFKNENYRPIRFLPHVTVVFECIFYIQINNYMENELLNHIRL